jgi:peptidoglycan/xylan/chitin deacetylase (PgdA/CDA1 family)
MTWQDITQLYREGHDIESHSMTHKVLDKLSANALDYEVGQSKQCLHDHLGIYPTVFSPPHGRGSKNATVINTIANYYDLSMEVLLLDLCSYIAMVGKNNKFQFKLIAGHFLRYDIKERTHNALDKRYSHNDTQIFEKFVELVNSQTNYTKDGRINAIPIIGYHDIDNNKTITSTNVNLFDAEMQYLHDNHFKVITMADLAYDENNNYLYIKGL